EIPAEAPEVDVLALDEALGQLEREDPVSANLVKLRFFAGLGQGEAAEALQLPRRTADRHWAFARAWLYDRLGRGEGPSRGPGRPVFQNLAQLGCKRSTEE